MADLKQMKQLLNSTTSSLNSYSNIFNNVANEVIKDTEAMGTSAVALKSQLNQLFTDAKQIGELGKSINLDDKGQVDRYIAKIVELDKTVSSLTPSINANISEMNTALQKEFKLGDGSTGYLKSQINELISLFGDANAIIDVRKLAPDLANFADDFVKQANQIEYHMGRLTEFGKQRNETDKALGFKVTRADIEPILESKRAQLTEYDTMAKGYGYKGLDDSGFSTDFPEIRQDIDTIRNYTQQLEESVGRDLKGYVEFYKEANNIFGAGKANKDLFETISNPMTRSLYEESGQVDWSKMTPSGLKALDSGLGATEFDATEQSFEKIVISSENATKSLNNYKEEVKNVASAEKELTTTQEKVSDISGINKSAESLKNVENSANSTSKAITSYENELQKLIETDTVLSGAQKQDILGKNFDKELNSHKSNIDYLTKSIVALGETKLINQPETKLDVNDSSANMKLTSYKTRIADATESLKTLEEEQKKLFNGLADPSKAGKLFGNEISSELFNGIRSVLESGYKVNLLDGSADKEKLEQLKSGFESLVSKFKEYKYDAVPDSEIVAMNKLNAMQSAITAETRKRTEEAQAQARYEQDKVRYLEQYKKLAQANANISALESTRNSLMTGANKDDKKAISERYNAEIVSNKSAARNAQQAIEKYKSEFARYNLEIPVTPVIKANANLSGNFKTDHLKSIASGRNEILGGLSGNEATIAKLNQQAQALGINVDKINSRLSAMSTTIKTAFYSGDIERASSLMSAYGNEVDNLKNKVEGQSKSQDIAKERQRQAAEEAQRVAKAQQKAAEDAQKAAEQQAKAQQKAAEGAQKAAEKERRAYEESVNAARQKVTQTLSLVKSFADGVNNAVNKVVSIIRTGIRLVNGIIRGIAKTIATLGNGVKSIISLFGSLSNRVRGTSSDSKQLSGSFNILAGTATELRSKIMLLKGAFDTIFNNQMVKKAENLMASVYSLKNIAGGGVTQEVLDWANSMEYAFGISAKELIGDINELTGVLYGLGMTAEDTAVGSENLLMMSRYLAFMGAAGGDTKTVMTKLVSGMKGMTQAIDDLGLSVRDAQMDSFLESLKAQGGEFANIATDFSSLNEEARVYVRYAALIDQFTRNYDITNFAQALDTVTGRMQIMKQTAASLVTTIGTGLAKAISKLAIFIVPLLKTIEAAVTKIFAFFGIDVSMTTDINEGTDAIGGLNDGIDDTKDKLDEVDKSANKAKGSLQSFDRVNNVTSSSSSSSGSGSGGFDYKKLMTSMLGDLNNLAEEASKSFADSMQEKMQEALKTAWDKFVKYAKKITGRNVIDLEFDWNSIKESLNNIWKNIKTLIKSWGTFFIEIGIKFLDDINIGKIITKFLEFTSAVTDLAVAFSEVLIPVLRNFYDEVLSPIVKLVGEKIADAFDKAIEKVKEWTKYLKDNKPELIEEWTEKLKHFFNVVTGKESANPEDGVIGTVLEILNKIGKVIEALIPIVSELASALGVFLKEEFLPWLNEKLGELAKWLSENKDDIVKFLKEIAGFVWDSFKIFVDLVSKLVDFCVKHPTAVKAFLVGLVAIKIASWATSSAAGIGQLIFQLKLLSKLGGITKALGGIGTAATAATTATSTELATIGVASGAAAKTSVLSKILGTTGSLASVESADGAILSSYMMGGSGVLGGLAKFGTFMGSGATTAGGVAAAGGASIAGIVGGIAGIGSGIKDLYSASKETNEEIKEQKNWSGGTKIGMVGAGAATGAAIGSIVPGVGTAVGAAVGAGVGGVAAIFKGSEVSEWLHNAWDNTLKPFFTETIPEAFGKLVEGLKTFFTETVPTTVSNIGNDIKTFFTETVPNFFGNLIEGVVQFFTEDLPLALGYIAGSIKVFFTETLPGFFSNLVNGVVQFFTEDVPYALGYIAGSLTAFFTETIPNFFGGLWENITTFFTETIPTALETIRTKAITFLTETIPNFFSDIWENIKTFFTETIPTTLETISTKARVLLTETIPNFFAGIWENIKTFFTETIPNAVDKIKNKARTFLTETIPTLFSGIWNSLKAFFTETIPTAVSKVKTGITTFFTETIPNKIKGLFSEISNAFSRAVADAKTKFSNIGSSFSTGFDAAVSSKTKASTAQSVTTHAVGGSIAGGQLFIANENSGAELVGNITGASGAQVANNGMIIEAMTSGVFEGVYNALAEVNNQRVGNNIGSGNTTIKLDGFGLIDSSTLSELARMLAPYLSSNNKNIADVNFSI